SDAVGVAERAVQGKAFAQLHTLWRQRGQALQRGLPTRQVTVADGQLGSDLFAQAVCPARQRAALQLIAQTLQIKALDHGRATSEAKFRHWNHGTTWLKPASSKRWRCTSRLSGFMTFSRALRFWAISSSL